MHWLFEGSDEAPDLPGLGLLSGQCHRLHDAEGIKIPHVGWNTLALQREASTSETVAVAEHGEPFTAVVQRANIAGVQFHPEKSGEVGLQILRNFVQQAG